MSALEEKESMVGDDPLEFTAALVPLVSRLSPYERSILEEIYQKDRNSVISSDTATIISQISEKIISRKQSIFTNLFENRSTDEVKSGMKTENKMSSLTYGEIDYFSFLDILYRSGMKPGDVFVDLGSGTGKGLIVASLNFGDKLSKIIGIEISEYLHNIAIEQVKQYSACLENLKPTPCTNKDNIECHLGDFIAMVPSWQSAGKSFPFQMPLCFVSICVIN